MMTHHVVHESFKNNISNNTHNIAQGASCFQGGQMSPLAPWVGLDSLRMYDELHDPQIRNQLETPLGLYQIKKPAYVVLSITDYRHIIMQA